VRDRFDILDDLLDARGADGYLIEADGDDADQFFLSGYHAPDPFTTLYTPDGVHLLVSGLEYTRAKTDSGGDTVRRHSEFDNAALREEYGRFEGSDRVLAAFLDEYGVESVSVPGTFPIARGDGLRDLGVEVVPDREGAVADVRAIKTDEEVEYIRATQKATEASMAAAEALISGATVDDDDTLYHEGEVLTSDRVRTEIEETLRERNCVFDECIVACGPAAARGHDTGSGPLLADTPIVVDIYPYDRGTKFYADMTRTFVKGEPSEQIREWYDLTEEALAAALDAIEPGVTGSEVHDAVCDVYEAAGQPTLRSDESTETGFFHSTGHGVGLEVHESPYLSRHGGELRPGHVVTVEPGLYDPEIGGVRIEDLVVVTEDGYENLTDYRIELCV
jgi:Xaa-Pro aminopeptidase